MRIAIGGDSAGRGLADLLVAHPQDRDGLEVTSISDTPSGAGELYAELSERAGHAILDGRFDRAILCCGTGIGVCMSANKIRGIRAAQTHDVYSAERAALSNDAHIITMGSRVIGPELAKSVAEAWLSKSFDPSSASAKNVDGVNELDKKYAIDRR